MKKFRVLTVLAASTAMAMAAGTPAWAEDTADGTADAAVELPADNADGLVAYEDDGSAVEATVETGVKEDVVEPEIVVDPAVDEQPVEAGEVPDGIMYMTGAGGGDEISLNPTDDVVEVAVEDTGDTVKDDMVDEVVSTRGGDSPLPYERNLEDAGDPNVIFYNMAGGEFGDNTADEAAEAAADNATSKVLDRVEVAANSRTPATTE